MKKLCLPSFFLGMVALSLGSCSHTTEPNSTSPYFYITYQDGSIHSSSSVWNKQNDSCLGIQAQIDSLSFWVQVNNSVLAIGRYTLGNSNWIGISSKSQQAFVGKGTLSITQLDTAICVGTISGQFIDTVHHTALGIASVSFSVPKVGVLQ
jgi:hypothetical protein